MTPVGGPSPDDDVMPLSDQEFNAFADDGVIPSAPDVPNDYQPVDEPFREVARKGWENYHALAVFYNDGDHLDRFDTCPAETCVWASAQLARSAETAKPFDPDDPAWRIDMPKEEVDAFMDALADNLEPCVFCGRPSVSSAVRDGTPDAGMPDRPASPGSTSDKPSKVSGPSRSNPPSSRGDTR